MLVSESRRGGIVPATEITVRGKPAPQGSKNIFNGHLVESSKAVKPWREAIRAETQRVVASPEAGAVEVVITFFLPRPKSHYGTGKNARLLKAGAPAYPSVMPDVDKLARAICDGLTQGGAYRDDAQVVHLDAWKKYADEEAPGCRIVIHKVACE